MPGLSASFKIALFFRGDHRVGRGIFGFNYIYDVEIQQQSSVSLLCSI